MNYLYYEDDEVTILLKSSNVNDLLEIVKEKELTGYSISDEPINYEEEYYTSLTFMTNQGKGGAKGKNLTIRTQNEN